MKEKTLITCTSPDGITLNTAGAYCDRDIGVIPRLQEKTATKNEVIIADNGYAGLKSVDTTPVFEAGKKSEYDAFWDSYQWKGARYNYDGAFYGNGWTNELLKPKYDMKPTRAMYMFAMAYFKGDLDAHFKELGIILDTSECSYFTQIFANNMEVTVVPPLDLSSCRSGYTHAMFHQCEKLKTIKKLVWNENISPDSIVNLCRKLETLIMEGTIGVSGKLGTCSPLLSKESLVSIINALSSTTNGLWISLPLTAIKNAFETSEGAADGLSSDEWLQLIATKPNWTINTIDE